MCDKCAPALSPASAGSRRRRLWDLPHQCHCPVVGVCLPLETLRHLVNKSVGAKAVADDYEVHVGAVAQCDKRNRLSERLQAELDRRYARKLQTYRAAKTTLAVAELWAAAVREGDVAGDLWAALTHPRCDELLQEALCRDIHMLQHQAGATVRVDLAKFNALAQEHAVLCRELGRAQERCTRLLTEKSTEIERLNEETLRLRAVALGKDSRIAFLQQDLEALKETIPDFETAERLQKKIEQMALRQAQSEAQNAELRHKLNGAMKSLEALQNANAAAAVAEPAAAPVSPVILHLGHKTVLCVGGRNGNIANYRELIEKVGGRFAHHDGGLEDGQNVLDASLAAADLVICQTGCISHNAYWKVKDFCKRSGTRCVFVDNPSSSSLARGLAQIAREASAGSLVDISPSAPKTAAA